MYQRSVDARNYFTVYYSLGFHFKFDVRDFFLPKCLCALTDSVSEFYTKSHHSLQMFILYILGDVDIYCTIKCISISLFYSKALSLFKYFF